MIPYASFLYFGVLLYVAVPAVLLGLAGRNLRPWILAATVGMLLVQYGGILRIEPGVEVREFWLVAAYALFEWVVAVGFLRLRARADRRWVFYAAVALALLPMVAGKYVPILAPQFQFGFLGISYVTLRAVDIVICTQDRLIVSLPVRQFFAFLFFFATISSGPIDRYRRFAGDWERRRTRAEFLDDMAGAVHRLFRGFFYKFVLATLIERHWMAPAAARVDLAGTLSYMYAYSFYLFFDFAGYTAFAIGIGYLFGVHTPENFDRPFLARDIRDFWNRWNITLSWWLRDHIYMRFVMAALKGRWFASKYVASYLGFFLAFGLMGLWHGAALHYVLYGLYHGALLSSHEAFARWNKRRKLWGDGPLWHAAGVFLTFHCVCLGFLLFSGHLTAGGARHADRAGAASAYEGSYERASCEEIGGWARDRANPQAPVDVEIVADGRVLATVRADLYRRDLADAGKGSGEHGFVYVLPRHLQDGSRHEVAVRIAGTGIALGDEPKAIVCSIPVRSMDGGDDALAAAAAAAAVPEKRELPVYVDNRDGTIAARHTGLMWEKKVALDGTVEGANLHDTDNCYPWAGTCAADGADCRVDADCGEKGRCRAGDCQAAAPNGRTIFQWIEQLNAARFAGYDDWRLPTAQELHGIVTPLEEGDPATRAAFVGEACGAGCRDIGDPACSCTQTGLYWAGSNAPSPDEAWMAFFYCNGNLFLDVKSNTFFVRAVRGGAPPP